MEEETFGKLREAKECQFGKIEDLMLWNWKQRGTDFENYFAEILFIFSYKKI